MNLKSPQADALAEAKAAIRAAGFRLLLDGGAPVSLDEWARAAEVDRAALGDIVDRAVERGRAQLDEAGRLVGVAGLSVVPTRHRIEVATGTRWTWCALDAIGILGALEVDGEVRSTDPATGNDVLIRFQGGVPDGDATLFVLERADGVNMLDSWCPNVNFFAERAEAERWVATRGLVGDVVPVRSIVEEAAASWRPVVGR